MLETQDISKECVEETKCKVKCKCKIRYRVCNNDTLKISYRVTDKIRWLLSQHNDPVTSVNSDISLLVKI